MSLSSDIQSCMIDILLISKQISILLIESNIYDYRIANGLPTSHFCALCFVLHATWCILVHYFMVSIPLLKYFVLQSRRFKSTFEF